MASRAFLITPPGRGAVATIALHGLQAWDVVARCFRPASMRGGRSVPAIGRVQFGRWPLQAGADAAESGNVPAEEVVVCRISPEGMAIQCVEIHCHGGPAAWRAIMETLLARGCEAGDWKDAALTVSDALRAEAAIALCQATTERTASILLDQYSGALTGAIARLREQLSGGDLSGAGSQLQRLLAWGNLGCHLNAPFKVVLAGAPNVGKSSLINRLAGYERSIVFDQPGTTRDVVTASTAIDGWPVELADTAGLRTAADELEAAGVAAAGEQLDAADLVVLVFDVSQPWTTADEGLLRQWPLALVAENKRDRAPGIGVRRGLLASAKTGQGISELLAEIARRLVPNAPQPGEAVPFLPRHYEILRRTALRLAHGDVTSACESLDWLDHSSPH